MQPSRTDQEGNPKVKQRQDWDYPTYYLDLGNFVALVQFSKQGGQAAFPEQPESLFLSPPMRDKEAIGMGSEKQPLA